MRLKDWSRPLLAPGVAFGLALAMSTQALAAAEPKIGVTSAVLPQAEGGGAGGMKTLQIGIDVHANDRVTTNANGKVQLVFVDGTALTVGPNSDVVLDEFVYNPETKDGTLSFSATKGLFRLVGGKLSKKKPVTLKFPTATMGIRGGIAMATAGDTVTGIFIYGEEMTMTSAGQTQTVNRPGFQVNVPSGNAPPGNPTPASNEQLGNTLEQFEASEQGGQQDDGQQGGQQGGQQAGQAGGSGGGNPAVSDEDVNESQLSDLGSNQGPENTGPRGDGPPAITPNVNPAEPDLVEASQRQQTDGTSSENNNDSDSGGSDSGSGSGSGTQLTLTGFVGRSKRGTSTATGSNDNTTADNLALSSITIANGRFQSGSFDLFVPASAGTFTLGGANTPLTTPYTGSAAGTVQLTSDLEFMVYRLTSPGRILLFAGVPTSSFPTSGVTAYDFSADFPRASDLPFMDTIATNNHGDAFIYWGSGATGVLPAFGGGTVLLKGAGSSQQSAWSTMFGRVRPDGSGRHVQGTLRSHGLYGATQTAIKFLGGISSSDAGGGSDFFGGTAPDYFVLESSLVSDADVVQSRGTTRETQTGSNTIFGNTIATGGTNSLTSATRTAGQRTTAGFAAGTVARSNSSSITSRAVLRNRNNSPVDVRLTTDANQNTVAGTFRLDDVSTGDDYDLIFGEATQTGRSAFINDSLLFAGESATASTIAGRVLTDTKLGLVSSGVLQHDGVLPSGVSFCSCQHLRWGVFGATFDISGGTSEQIHLATWVQGTLTSFASFPSSGTAQYSGHVIGSVVNGANQYVAVGGITMNVSFGAGNYQLTNVAINQFDGTNYTATAGASFNFTANSFNSTTANLTIQGNKSGVGTVNAVVHGAFFGSATGAPPETGGTVTFTGTNYNAGATYAAKR